MDVVQLKTHIYRHHAFKLNEEREMQHLHDSLMPVLRIFSEVQEEKVQEQPSLEALWKWQYGRSRLIHFSQHLTTIQDVQISSHAKLEILIGHKTMMNHVHDFKFVIPLEALESEETIRKWANDAIDKIIENNRLNQNESHMQ